MRALPKSVKSVGYILTLGMFLIAMNIGGIGGCGSGTSRAGTGDDTVTATSTDANTAYSGAFDAVSAALTTSEAGLTLKGGNKLAQAIDALKNTITVTSASSCSEGDVPSPTQKSGTVAGSDIFSGGSGSCAVDWDEGSGSLDVLVDCASLSDGTDTLDGKLGFAATLSGSDVSLDVGSQDLSFTFDGNNCSLIANLSIGVTLNEAGTGGSVSADGCLSLCGEAFDISGSESF